MRVRPRSSRAKDTEMKTPVVRETSVPAQWRTGFDEFINRFFGNGNGIMSRLPEAFQTTNVPAVDVSETEKNLAVAVALPGLNENDIQVNVLGNQVTVSGERKWEEDKKTREFHRVESQYGAFSRTIVLPDGLRKNDAEATYKNGVLT